MSDILAELAVKITADSSQLVKGFAAAEKETKTLGQKLNQVGKYAGIASAAIVTGFGAATLKFAKTADEIQEMSQRTGIGTTALQELSYAAGLTGSSLDGLETATKRMAVAIYSGSDALTDLGFNIDDLKKMSPEQQFLAIAGAIAEIEDPTQRAAVAVEIFGRSGTDLLPMLANGKQGLQDMRDEAQKLNAVMGEDAVNAGAKLQDGLDKLKKALDGLAVSIGIAVAGDFDKFITKLTEIITQVSKWIEENPRLIRTIFEIAAAIVVLTGVMKIFAIAQAIATAAGGWSGIAALVVGAAAATAAVIGIEQLFNSPTMNPSIPAYAEGGIVPGTGPQLAMVHGGETIIPAGQGGNINLYIDGEVVANVVEKRLYDRLRYQEIPSYL